MFIERTTLFNLEPIYGRKKFGFAPLEKDSAEIP